MPPLPKLVGGGGRERAKRNGTAGDVAAFPALQFADVMLLLVRPAKGGVAEDRCCWGGEWHGYPGRQSSSVWKRLRSISSTAFTFGLAGERYPSRGKTRGDSGDVSLVDVLPEALEEGETSEGPGDLWLARREKSESMAGPKIRWK